MAVNRFVLNGISYHGHGAINEIPGIVASHGFKKAFVASDPDLIRFGVTARVTDLLEKNGIAYELYSDIKPNPTIENVQHGVDAFRASGADFMITIGGGSSMDTGKGIGIIVNNPEFYDVRSRIHHCRPHHRRYRRRVHDQLRHYRRRKEAEVRLRRPERHS